ncbi:MAG: hypothetical protein PGMFKBFP_00914 [Anaerolineales bacterium]|nr:hypothetical protein [Anaerolineales bacterium]
MTWRVAAALGQFPEEDNLLPIAHLPRQVRALIMEAPRSRIFRDDSAVQSRIGLALSADATQIRDLRGLLDLFGQPTIGRVFGTENPQALVFLWLEHDNQAVAAVSCKRGRVLFRGQRHAFDERVRVCVEILGHGEEPVRAGAQGFGIIPQGCFVINRVERKTGRVIAHVTEDFLVGDNGRPRFDKRRAPGQLLVEFDLFVPRGFEIEPDAVVESDQQADQDGEHRAPRPLGRKEGLEGQRGQHPRAREGGEGEASVPRFEFQVKDEVGSVGGRESEKEGKDGGEEIGFRG